MHLAMNTRVEWLGSSQQILNNFLRTPFEEKVTGEKEKTKTEQWIDKFYKDRFAGSLAA